MSQFNRFVEVLLWQQLAAIRRVYYWLWSCWFIHGFAWKSCADYAGKVERNLPKGGSRNPAVICQYLTFVLRFFHHPRHFSSEWMTADPNNIFRCDNVEDIAGLASDLYGSCAEPSCAALFVASISSFMLHLHGYVQSTDDQLHGNLTLLDNHTFCNWHVQRQECEGQ